MTYSESAGIVNKTVVISTRVGLIMIMTTTNIMIDSGRNYD